MAGFLYALYSVFSRIIGNSFATFYQTWSRGLIVLAFFVIAGLYTKAYTKIKKKDVKWFLIISISSALTFAPYYLAVLHLSIGVAMFLFYAVNLISSVLLGKIIFGEKFTTKKNVTFLLALLGMVMLFADSMKFYALQYLFFALIAGLFYSFCSALTKKISSDYSNFQISTINAFVIVVVNFLFSIALKESWYVQFLSIPWLANYAYAIASISTTVLVIYGFKKVEIHLGSLLMLSELPFVVLFGWLFYDEIPTVFSIIGGVLIIASMIIPNLKESDLNKIFSKFLDKN